MALGLQGGEASHVAGRLGRAGPQEHTFVTLYHAACTPLTLQPPYPPRRSPFARREPRFGLVYAILVILGVGTMLPFNVFMTEAEFFNVRMHVPPYNPVVSDNFISLFGLTFNALWVSCMTHSGCGGGSGCCGAAV